MPYCKHFQVLSVDVLAARGCCLHASCFEAMGFSVRERGCCNMKKETFGANWMLRYSEIKFRVASSIPRTPRLVARYVTIEFEC